MRQATNIYTMKKIYIMIFKKMEKKSKAQLAAKSN